MKLRLYPYIEYSFINLAWFLSNLFAKFQIIIHRLTKLLFNIFHLIAGKIYIIINSIDNAS